MLRKQVTIVNKLGLHARAAAKLVRVAARYASEVSLIKNNDELQKINGKSIMGVMMLAATKGTKITLEVEGQDETLALSALEELIDNRFGETD